MKTYQPGDAFGELALLYNAPRAATITAVSDCFLWALDRHTFNHIVKNASTRKREQYEDFLAGVTILKNMEAYERARLAEALKEESYSAGDFIIQEGESGEIFYMVLSGEVVATKTLDHTVQELKRYGPGDYFGEIALLMNAPRAANVQCVSDRVKVVALERGCFKRLLGPLDEILKRNMDSYLSMSCDIMQL